jgi:hypothetical protein
MGESITLHHTKSYFMDIAAFGLGCDDLVESCLQGHLSVSISMTRLPHLSPLSALALPLLKSRRYCHAVRLSGRPPPLMPVLLAMNMFGPLLSFRLGGMLHAASPNRPAVLFTAISAGKRRLSRRIGCWTKTGTRT